MLVETPEMRKRSLNIFFSWLIVAMVYYGLSFNSKNIGGNRYVASFASGFVEVPGFEITSFYFFSARLVLSNETIFYSNETV
jgi:MFS transporter, OCT family, solute carrier family 22 (organic cation transporter), member 4/5